MKILLAIATITFLIACGTDPRDETGTTSTNSSNRTVSSSSNGQNDKNYTVTTSNGTSCSVMIRNTDSYLRYTLQCPSGTKIYCMRVYDNSNFVLGSVSHYVSVNSFGLVAADGYGSGSFYMNSGSRFESIVRVSLSDTSCSN